MKTNHKTIISITNVRFVAASQEDTETGLVGYVSQTLNRCLQIEGLILRRTTNGRLTISFPARTDRCGRRHFFICPRDDETRLAIENQVLAALGYLEN
jgi:DNA-binding cell septation regulator SpoVG